ncbi:flagellar filament capping protein FliD [Actinoplanes friuliensis]|uniref:Flagellar hook-associated protein 2 n=1 Tax=Actinoplanes friuliensis DSM 7358 TaxID=1246995 RepID=U5WE78_9ACTN|nr:flagellar filament capping protein FliD [Actinoplanes friuliensis]AGZ46335.1 flagellar hook-associated 2 domain-containing protein [Actinoplanes friuliensis DSM 7358]
MASVDGLVTGMSTTDTINQLMKIEAAPQAALRNKVNTANKVVTAYQSVNSRMSSIGTAAKALTDANSWKSMKATSSSDAAVVSAQPGASAGSMSFRVNQLATTHAATFTGGSVTSISDAATSPVMNGSSFDIELADGTTQTVSPTDASLQSVVSAINNTANAAYKASAVQISPGKYTLQLTATKSGQDGDFAIPSGLDNLGTGVVTTQGANAQLTVGTTADAYTIESASNTFADVLPGVTVTATKVQSASDAQVTIDLSSDTEGLAAKVQALVDNANTALTEIAAQSKTKSGEISAGVLVGDSAMRKLTQDILSAVSGGATGLGSNGGNASYNAVGISVDRSGKLTFDKDKFLESYKADPAKTQQFFDGYEEKAGGTPAKFDPGHDTSVGLARKLDTLALVATEGVVDPTNPTRPKEGILQGLIQRRNDNIRRLNDQVSEWDIRLDLRKTSLQRQFSNLEVAMGKMQQQSSWLSSQLANL